MDVILLYQNAKVPSSFFFCVERKSVTLMQRQVQMC
jgi:hypothetical protein